MMIKKSNLFLNWFFFLFVSVYLIFGFSTCGQSIAPIDNLKAVIVISDTTEFIENWVDSSTELITPNVNQFVFGERIYVAFIVTGYGRNENSETNLVVGFRVLNPEGSVVGGDPEYSAAKWKVGAESSAVLTIPTLDLELGDDRTPGKYVIEVSVHDYISGRSVQSEAEFFLKVWDRELVERQSKFFSAEKAFQLIKKGEYVKAGFEALSLYAVDRGASIEIVNRLREKVDEPIEDFLIRVYHQSIVKDPSIQLSKVDGSLNRDWKSQKAAWCDLLINSIIESDWKADPLTSDLNRLRSKGVSVYFIPGSVLRMDPALITQGRFRTTIGNNTESFRTPKELVDFYQALNPKIKKHGIWLVITHPESYSIEEKEILVQLEELCKESNIPLFKARGSHLPDGWRQVI